MFGGQETAKKLDSGIEISTGGSQREVILL